MIWHFDPNCFFGSADFEESLHSCRLSSGVFSSLSIPLSLANSASISAKLLPFVSGANFIRKTRVKAHTAAKIMNT